MDWAALIPSDNLRGADALARPAAQVAGPLANADVAVEHSFANPDPETQLSGATAQRPQRTPTMRFRGYTTLGQSDAADRPRLAIQSIGGYIVDGVSPVYLPGVPAGDAVGLDQIDYAATLALPFPQPTGGQFLTFTNDAPYPGSTAEPTPAPHTDAHLTRSGFRWRFAPDGFASESYRFRADATHSRLVVKSDLDPALLGAAAFGIDSSGPPTSLNCYLSVRPPFLPRCTRYRDAVMTGLTDVSQPRHPDTDRTSGLALSFAGNYVRRQTDRTGVELAAGKAFQKDSPIGTVLINPELQLGLDAWSFSELETFSPLFLPEFGDDHWTRDGDGHSVRAGLGIEIERTPGEGDRFGWSLAAEYGADFIDLKFASGQSPNAPRFPNYYEALGTSPTSSLSSTMSYGAVRAGIEYRFSQNWSLFVSAEQRWEAFITDS